MSSFDEWFKRATGNEPFPFQRRFAEEREIPQLVDVPTGLGKTVMALLGCGGVIFMNLGLRNHVFKRGCTYG